MTLSTVTIQVTPDSLPSTPGWMGEVAAFAQVLTQTGSLKAIQEQVRFARARFGHYDLIDFVVVLIGYALSGEPTLLAFYERLAPFAELFMALFGVITFFRTIFPAKQKAIRAGEEKEAFPTRICPSNTGRWTRIFGCPEQTVSPSVRSGANVHEEALFLWKCC